MRLTNELAARRLEAFERSLLVRPHQPRIPLHIGGEDRGETAGGRHCPAHPKGLKAGTPSRSKSRRFRVTTVRLLDHCGGGNHGVGNEIGRLSVHQLGPAAEGASMHRQDIVGPGDPVDPALDDLGPSSILLSGVLHSRLKFSEGDRRDKTWSGATPDNQAIRPACGLGRRSSDMMFVSSRYITGAWAASGGATDGD